MNFEVTTGVALDVVIGLAFLYFLLSVICSALNEALASLFRWRAKDLKLAIVNVLGSDKAARLYADARIQVLGKVKRVRCWQRDGSLLKRSLASLQRGRLGYAADGTSRLAHQPDGGEGIFRLRDPSYIPPKTFARIALDLLVADDPDLLRKLGISSRKAREAREAMVAAQGGSEPLLEVILREAGTDSLEKVEEAQASLEAEFDDVMDRVSGWYKRKATIWVAVIAAVVVFALNADTFNVTKGLAADSATRATIVAAAERQVAGTTGSTGATGSAGEEDDNQGGGGDEQSGGDEKDPSKVKEHEKPAQEVQASVREALDAGFPLGWKKLPWKGDLSPESIASKIAGILLTIIAVSLGGPFWFQILSRLVPLRATGGKPDEKKA